MLQTLDLMEHLVEVKEELLSSAGPSLLPLPPPPEETLRASFCWSFELLDSALETVLSWSTEEP